MQMLPGPLRSRLGPLGEGCLRPNYRNGFKQLLAELHANYIIKYVAAQLLFTYSFLPSRSFPFPTSYLRKFFRHSRTLLPLLLTLPQANYRRAVRGKRVWSRTHLLVRVCHQTRCGRLLRGSEIKIDDEERENGNQLETFAHLSDSSPIHLTFTQFLNSFPFVQSFQILFFSCSRILSALKSI